MDRRLKVVIRVLVLTTMFLSLLMGDFQPVQAATCTWTGAAATTDWFTPGNWTNCNSGVPGSADAVVIADVSIDPILTADAEIAALTINSNGVLNIGFDSTLTVGTFDLYGRLTGLGDLIITGSMFWGHGGGGNDGTMDGSGTTTLNSGATLNFQTAAYQALYERTFNNNGTMNQTNEYGFKVDRGAVLNNAGTLNVNNSSASVELFMREDYPGNGVVNNSGLLMVYDSSLVGSEVTLNNSGTIELENGAFTFKRSGTHSGSIIGETGSIVLFANADSLTSVDHTFTSSSSIAVPNLIIDDVNLDVSGVFNISNAAGTYLNCTNGSELAFQDSAAIVALSEKITLSQCHLSFPASLSGLIQPKVLIGSGSQLTNLGSWSISSELRWFGGMIDGSGTTSVLMNSVYRMFGSGGLVLNAQTINNQTTASWEANTITLGSNAHFVNQATFEAKATTAMNGDNNGLFDNQGLFVKKTDETTTTMNIGFTNQGEILVEGGTLIFPDGITSGSGTVITLGGDFQSSGTLDLQGATLNGSGTVDGDVNNAGLVTPGNSPGKIIVSGNYTQTTAGVLTIELAGTNAETALDVLEVGGAASLAGTLTVELIDGFIPVDGDQFEVLRFVSFTGDFETVNLPDLPEHFSWERAYTETGLVLSVAVDPTYTVFIPLVVR